MTHPAEGQAGLVDRPGDPSFNPAHSNGGPAGGGHPRPPPSSPPPSVAVLSVQGVRVEFGDLTAVHDISFDLGPGQLLGLIGPNGAGKTTLLRAIVGLQPTAAGRVSVLGRPVRAGDSASLAHVGFTPDTPPVYARMTVRDFLRFVARGYGLTRAEGEERIDFWLEKVWLTEKADVRMRALSRGMRQRVGIARTLLPNPHVVLLDEPAGGLDPGGRVQFRQLLVDLREQGKALIVSSHILSDLADYCTHVGIMAGGRMLRLGTVAEIAAAAEGGQMLAGGPNGEAGGGAANAGRSRYTLVLARPVAAFAEQLERLPGVSGARVERDRAVFEYASDREAAAGLLADLVGRGLPVASFAPNAIGLEEAYLRSGIGQVD